MPAKPGDPLKPGDSVSCVMGAYNGEHGTVTRIEHPLVYVKLDSGEEVELINWQLVRDE